MPSPQAEDLRQVNRLLSQKGLGDFSVEASALGPGRNWVSL